MKMTLILSNHTLNGALVTNLLNEKSRLHKNTAGKVWYTLSQIDCITLENKNQGVIKYVKVQKHRNNENSRGGKADA